MVFIRSGYILFFCFMLMSGIARAGDYTIGNISIADPWARVMVPTAKTGAGYFSLVNRGDSADRLVAIQSDVAARIEMHEIRMENNVMKMRKLTNGMEIAPHGSLVLQPGGYHIMFFNPHRSFREGDSFRATLSFEKAGEIEVDFSVRAVSSRKVMQNTEHDMGEHEQRDLH